MSIKRNLLLGVQILGSIFAVFYALLLILSFWALIFPNPEITDPMYSTGVAWGLATVFYLAALPALFLAIAMFLITKNKAAPAAIKGSYLIQIMLVICVIINSLIFL